LPGSREVLVDSHCHLDFPALAEEGEAVIERARAAGVQAMQTIGTSLATFDRVLAIVEAHSGVYCSVGVHPHRAAKERIEDPGPLLARIGHPKVIGIGESGLDYYYDHGPRDVQAEVFRAHITAARGSGLPLIVHTRDADRDTIAILREEMAQGPFGGVIHCYSSSPELAFQAVDLGLYLGIGGIITFKRSEELRRTARDLPLERLLLETDAPYLAPEPFRGKRNEPAYVARVAATLAEIKGLMVAEVERATTANFFRLFAKAQPPDGGPCA
jgi:TatD DNase family protein